MSHHSIFKIASKRNITIKCLPVKPKFRVFKSFPSITHKSNSQCQSCFLWSHALQIAMTPQTSLSLISSFIISLKNHLVNIWLWGHVVSVTTQFWQWSMKIVYITVYKTGSRADLVYVVLCTCLRFIQFLHPFINLIFNFPYLSNLHLFFLIHLLNAYLLLSFFLSLHLQI